MSFYPVADDIFVVDSERSLFEAARSFSENHNDDYTFEYEEYPHVFMFNEEKELSSVWPMPKFPCAIIFAMQASEGVNHLPKVDMVRIFDMQESFQMFNSLIEAGGQIGE